ncbi:MAG: peptidoglycan-associated lipoprotein Pal [Alphaproteobacteria bacterium]
MTMSVTGEFEQTKSSRLMKFGRASVMGLTLFAVAACSSDDAMEDTATTEVPTYQQPEQPNTAPSGSVDQGYLDYDPRSGYVRDETTSDPATEATQQSLAREAGDLIYFALNSHALSDDTQRTLRRQALWLRQNPQTTVTIEGHCDERGTRDYNLALGDRRANSVRDYLVSLGVQANRIATTSYGKERPIAVCSSEICWSKNRRAMTAVNVMF